ncbi:MAG: peptide deformylase [Desulfovibrionaceae bacterium]
MLLDIVTYPDPRLKRIAVPVEEISPEVRELAKNMAETMYNARGVGLAAPQVGHSIRLIVTDVSGPEERKALRVLVNPEIVLTGVKIRSEGEGCLSVPHNYRADVMRYSNIILKCHDLDGNTFEEALEDYPAIVVQHEIDHLEGTLFIDHISRLRRTLFDTKVKKWMKRDSQ